MNRLNCYTHMKKNSIGLTLGFVLFAFLSQAQNTGRLSGKIIDKLTQQPLANVNVSVVGTTKGNVSDSLGFFRITGLPLSSITVDFSSIGYKKSTLFNLILTSGNETNINIELEPEASSLKEVVVKTNNYFLCPGGINLSVDGNWV